MNLLVSIIIPTYNRAHLISETLDSVLAQTYTNWECIVVDDGSTDNTAEILNQYCKKDTRFQYHHRPKNRLKGANACRNYGFEISKGEYIQWFDSDDLMQPKKIEIKIDALHNSVIDFVIARTEDFYEGASLEKAEYPIVSESINLYNFVVGKVFWLTPDVLMKRKVIENVRFNEALKSGQEYNYFSKMLMKSNNGITINHVLTKRRIHSDSIQSLQRLSKKEYRLNKFKVFFKTYIEVKESRNVKVLNALINLSMSRAFEMISNKEKVPNFKSFVSSVNSCKGILKTSIFALSLAIAFFFDRGYFLMNYSRN